ncbi:MAG: S9 family peptidase [Candidatus Hydrogenedentes bacterium]|nr:S9 family peptidase [Candidatus Hydrogenedentota bacterium]
MNAAGDPMVYPETKRIDHVDTYHGAAVPDPYRWLEDDVRTSPEVADWVQRENEVTFAHLTSLPKRAAIEMRLTELWDYERYTAPFKAGGRYYYSKNNGLQNQPVIYVQETLDAEPQALIDPNTWSADGTVALGGMAFSDDGRYVAYGVAEAGSDWNTWRIMEIATRTVLPDAIKWVKYSAPTWSQDSSGLFYGRFPEPEAGAAFQSLTFNQKIYMHRPGTEQAADTLVYEQPDHPDWGFDITATEDGRYLVLSISVGTDERYWIKYSDMMGDAGFVDLIGNFEYDYSYCGNDGATFYFRTNNGAPRGRLIAIDLAHPEPASWRELIPETADTLRSVNLVGDRFIAAYLRDAKTHVAIHGLDGAPLRTLDLPGIGTAGGFSGKRTDTETFYLFSSYATPPSIYRYEMESGASTLLHQAEVDFQPEDYAVEQVFYTSLDGTRVPMFITARKDLKRDGSAPVLLYGYGGFNIPVTPAFFSNAITWMELGGAYAVANLRGGGEYGEAWHQGGTKLKKQNVFDDFIAAAEYLIANRYCTSKTLAIQGGSNGGLLVGAVMTQRPDLYAVALPAVGVMDMLRFHQFTAGRFWVDDYGSADSAEEFPALHAYSPYHNLKEGVRYPATLVTTADTDDRVVPGHSFKFAAALQRAQADPERPVLIRIETRAGHGAGKPTSKRIAEVADQYAFARYHMGLDRE